MKGFIYHTIKAQFGWGHQLRKLDVMRVANINYRKRWFRLFQRDLPYTLHITYDDPHDTTDIAPVFGGRLGFAVVDSMDRYRYITFRLPTFTDCEHEVLKISNRQDQVKKIREKILREYSD